MIEGGFPFPAQLAQLGGAGNVAQLSLAQAKATIQQRFSAANKVEGWPDVSSLFPNPFAYKGKIVGIGIKFDRMLAENEAVFWQFGGGMKMFLISGVPPTEFRGSEHVVMAAIGDAFEAGQRLIAEVGNLGVDRRQRWTPNRRPVDPLEQRQVEQNQDHAGNDPVPIGGHSIAPIHIRAARSHHLVFFQVAAAARHVTIAALRKPRCVEAEVRWRCT